MARAYKDTFRGTASYYARFRPGYPEAFFALLTQAFHFDGSGRLLDLGCGTGQITVPLAGRFAEVVAMDPEPEMLDEARRVASEAAVANISFVLGGSADLESMREQLGAFRLVTMGSSFHWMDREVTLAALSQMVVPGGGVVVASAGSLWTNPAPWCEAVKETVQRWLGEQRRAGGSTYVAPQVRHQTLIDNSKFGPCETHVLRYQRLWTIDGIIGHLYSTSFCSPSVLGTRRDAFESDLRDSLGRLNQDGRFTEDVTLEALLGFLR